MNAKKFKILIEFLLILSCIFVTLFCNCSRYKYLDLPAKEVTDTAENDIPYINKPEEEESITYTDNPQGKEPLPTATNEMLSNSKIEYGKASYYADKFQGKPTASGEPYDRAKLTAAHRTLPFGTRCRVTNTQSKKSVTVRINDRGPHVKRRIIDLSYEAMRLLDGVAAGEIDVMIKVLK